MACLAPPLTYEANGVSGSACEIRDSNHRQRNLFPRSLHTACHFVHLPKSQYHASRNSRAVAPFRIRKEIRSLSCIYLRGSCLEEVSFGASLGAHALGKYCRHDPVHYRANGYSGHMRTVREDNCTECTSRNVSLPPSSPLQFSDCEDCCKTASVSSHCGHLSAELFQEERLLPSNCRRQIVFLKLSEFTSTSAQFPLSLEFFETVFVTHLLFQSCLFGGSDQVHVNESYLVSGHPNSSAPIAAFRAVLAYLSSLFQPPPFSSSSRTLALEGGFHLRSLLVMTAVSSLLLLAPVTISPLSAAAAELSTPVTLSSTLPESRSLSSGPPSLQGPSLSLSSTIDSLENSSMCNKLGQIVSTQRLREGTNSLDSSSPPLSLPHSPLSPISSTLSSPPSNLSGESCNLTLPSASPLTGKRPPIAVAVALEQQSNLAARIGASSGGSREFEQQMGFPEARETFADAPISVLLTSVPSLDQVTGTGRFTERGRLASISDNSSGSDSLIVSAITSKMTDSEANGELPSGKLVPASQFNQSAECSRPLAFEERSETGGGLPMSDGQVAAVEVTNDSVVLEAWDVVNDVFLDARQHEWTAEAWQEMKQKVTQHPHRTRLSAYATISQMLSSLHDPYTRFLSPEQFSQLAKYDITGIGLNIGEEAPPGPGSGEVLMSGQQTGARLKVLGIVLGTPAQLAGIRQGDELLAVDGTKVDGMSAFEASSLIQGPKGSLVTLQFRHSPCSPPEAATMARTVDVRTPVAYRLERPMGGEGAQKATMGYIRLSEFNALAKRDLATAVERLQAAGATAFTLDLRDNPGGLVQAGIEIARLFLPEGSTVHFAIHLFSLLWPMFQSCAFCSVSPCLTLVGRRT
eukprot:TRINITY_DN2257_c0_g1_i1.p1 TRINITY_DN2257_c0_g1~~TRINITY_DN2257_c0_g1_i1.p1  ORF type:complete len:862 (-),score=108.08 TRINITY_DN2257_c0_g1_i1:393-2978(-)